MHRLLFVAAALFLLSPAAQAATTVVATVPITQDPAPDTVAGIEALVGDVHGLFLDETFDCTTPSLPCFSNDKKDPSYTVERNGSSGRFNFELPDSFELVYFTVEAQTGYKLYKLNDPANEGGWIFFDTAGLTQVKDPGDKKDDGGKVDPVVSNIYFFVQPAEPVPVPAAALLFPAGLGLIAWRRRQAK